MKNVIEVSWVPEKEYGYGAAMRVVASTHPRFFVGSRFDWGFASIATQEDGYQLRIYPMTAHVKAQIKAQIKAQEKPSNSK